MLASMGILKGILYYNVLNEHIQSSDYQHAMQNMSESAEKHPAGLAMRSSARSKHTVRGSDIRIYVTKL